MKVFFYSCLFIFVGINITNAQNSTTEKAKTYITQYKAIAMAEMQRTGIPASITLAQGLLESGYGESELCLKSNNHFGIKCKTEWTGPKTYHNDDARGECFRVYNSAEESYIDHSNFLKSRPHYNFLFSLPITDYEAWAKGLKKAGYATEAAYPQKLIKLINDYNLHEFTLQVVNNQFNLQKQDSIAIDTAEVIIQDTVLGELIIPMNTTTKKSVIANDDTDKDSVVIVNNHYTNKPSTDTAAALPIGIFTINHCKVVYALKGTSYLSIANEYKIDLAKLFEYNDMDATDVVAEHHLLFLQKKQSKGASDFHIVQAKETIYSIAQKEGIRLDKLLEYNKLAKNSTIKEGDKLYLRSTH